VDPVNRRIGQGTIAIHRSQIIDHGQGSNEVSELKPVAIELSKINSVWGPNVAHGFQVLKFENNSVVYIADSKAKEMAIDGISLIPGTFVVLSNSALRPVKIDTVKASMTQFERLMTFGYCQYVCSKYRADSWNAKTVYFWGLDYERNDNGCTAFSKFSGGSRCDEMKPDVMNDAGACNEDRYFAKVKASYCW
jgi:hypothetical protein